MLAVGAGIGGLIYSVVGKYSNPQAFWPSITILLLGVMAFVLALFVPNLEMRVRFPLNLRQIAEEGFTCVRIKRIDESITVSNTEISGRGDQ